MPPQIEDIYTYLNDSLLAFLHIKELLLVGREEQQAGGRVVGEVGDVGVEEPRVVELWQTDGGPALG